MILGPLFDLKFLTEFAAGGVGTSNRKAALVTIAGADQLIPGPAGKALLPTLPELGQSFRSRTSYGLPARARDRQAIRYAGWGRQLLMPDAEPAQLTARRVVD